MPKVLKEAISALQALDSAEQERAARVLIAFLNGSNEIEVAEA